MTSAVNRSSWIGAAVVMSLYLLPLKRDGRALGGLAFGFLVQSHRHTMGLHAEDGER